MNKTGAQASQRRANYTNASSFYVRGRKISHLNGDYNDY